MLLEIATVFPENLELGIGGQGVWSMGQKEKDRCFLEKRIRI